METVPGISVDGASETVSGVSVSGTAVSVCAVMAVSPLFLLPICNQMVEIFYEMKYNDGKRGSVK